MNSNYSMLIQWSDEDKIFVVTIPEFVGRVMMPFTHGDSYEDAVQAGQEVIETFLEFWTEDGQSCPEPQNLVMA